MTVLDELLAFITEITQFINLFEALVVFLSFFGVNL